MKTSILFALLLHCLTQSPANACETACISDFKVGQNKVPNRLTGEQFLELDALNEKNDVAGAWALLSSWGDHYADAAKEITRDNPSTPSGRRFQIMVKANWEHTVGKKNYDRYFKMVAHQHLTQYIQILKSGYWPDSDQILNSYLSALSSYMLPSDAAIDFIWEEAVLPQAFYSWQSLIHLEPARRVYPSRTCASWPFLEAFSIQISDLWSFLWR